MMGVCSFRSSEKRKKRFLKPWILSWPVFLCAVFYLLAGIPAPLRADQLSPDPNPSGNTITVTGSGSNASNPFRNLGVIRINAGGALTYKIRLDNYASCEMYNSGTLINTGTLTNLDWVSNSGTLSNYRLLSLAYLDHARPDLKSKP